MDQHIDHFRNRSGKLPFRQVVNRIGTRIEPASTSCSARWFSTSPSERAEAERRPRHLSDAGRQALARAEALSGHDEREEALAALDEDLTLLLDPDDPSILATVQSTARRLLSEHNIAVDSRTEAYWTLQRLLTRAMVETVRRSRRRAAAAERARAQGLALDPGDGEQPPQQPGRIAGRRSRSSS